MGEDILKSVCQLECVDVAKPELNMGIHDELGQAENLATQMEGISETRFLALLRRQCSNRLIRERTLPFKGRANCVIIRVIITFQFLQSQLACRLL